MRYLLTLLLMTGSLFGAASIQKASIVSSVIGVTPVGNDPVFDSVTHVWHLGEASGNARADLVGLIPLSETGGAVASGTGKHGNAADFNTAGRWLACTAGHNFGNESPPCMWMAMWVYVRSLPAAATVSYLTEGTARNMYLYVDHSGNVVFNDATSDDVDITQPLGALNTWHLIVVGNSIAGGTELLSVDNATLTTDSSILGGVPDDDLRLGVADALGSPTAPLVLDGLIDEVVIGTVDLTQSIVTSLWASGGGTFYSP